MQQKALIIFSGGQDSTTCLIQAMKNYGKTHIEAISFDYAQRHKIELEKAKWICQDLGIKQKIVHLDTSQITTNALTDHNLKIEDGAPPNTLVDGRNALFLLYSAIYAKQKNIQNLIIGVCETDFSGYPDCRQSFINAMQETLRLAMDYPFTLHTPLMWLNKAQTWQLADEMGFFEYILNHTHTCYQGIEKGCGDCPSCKLREKGLKEYLAQKKVQHV